LPGTLDPQDSEPFQAFIPDQGSAVMHHQFRFSPDGEWHENPAAMSELRASQPTAGNKALTKTSPGLATADPAKMPHYYQFGDGDNLRVWKRIDDQTWDEVYPDGFTSVFKVAGRTKVGQTEGTVVAKTAGDPSRTGTPNDGTLQAFIPDKGSAMMDHWFRFSPSAEWHDLAPMEDVK
jgi:hypothetical protein